MVLAIVIGSYCLCVFSYLRGLNLLCRVLVLTIGWIIFLSAFIPVHFLLKGHDKLRKNLEVQIVLLHFYTYHVLFVNQYCIFPIVLKHG